jgi:hypothetical protein
VTLKGAGELSMDFRRPLLGALCLALATAQSAPAIGQDNDPINPPPTAADWAGLAKLPDWSGVWTPDIRDQAAQEKDIPWNAHGAKLADTMWAESAAGNPRGLFVDCLPEAMPSWMMISHNSLEILFTPGRVTMLGESDSNRLRRIYTDGRAHPEDPDLTFHGHSTGKWEGDTLVIDTVGVLPQSYIAASEGVGVPNGGDMHIVERIRLRDPDTLLVSMVIDAPKVLAKPYETTRIYYRQRLQRFDIVEGVCIQGFFDPVVDADGHHFWKPLPYGADGNPIPLSASTTPN